MSEQSTGPARGGRYQRSFGGLVGALLVTIVSVVALVWILGLFRNTPDVEVETVDYREAVELAETGGYAVVHPERLPDGWRATAADPRLGDQPSWGMAMLTDDEAFVGIRQSEDSVGELVDLYVDEEADDEGPVEVSSAVADTWERWSDRGGDTGYTAEVDGQTVLVYGSAPAEVIERFIGTLVL